MVWARVSHLAAFFHWKTEDDQDVDWLLRYIRSPEKTEAMAKGTAFHSFLEHAAAGENIWQANQDGYRFVFTGDFELYLPPLREIRREKDYGGIVVSGQADTLIGGTIWDHKTTDRFDAERYLSGMQWRYYLDIFAADRFVWNVWEMSEIEPPSLPTSKELFDLDYPDPVEPPPAKTYEVYALHHLEQFRYPEMEAECRNLALEYKTFAESFLTQDDFRQAAMGAGIGGAD